MSSYTRRNVLRSSVAVAAASSAAAISGISVRSAIAQSVRIRQDVGPMDSNHPTIKTYKLAIAKMHALPTAHPHSWQSFAKIHDEFCPHGNWYFLPWHRAFLAAFEKVCRKVTGNPDFALPYWNWTKDPQFPRTFWGASNPLDPIRWNDPAPFTASGRQIGKNQTLPADIVGQAVITRIMDETVFEAFGSYRASSQRPTSPPWGGTAELEGLPHNLVHGIVGGHMRHFFSPLDPIFWLHHCNIDRLWAEWNEKGNRNSADESYQGYVFKQNFPGENENPYDIAVKMTNRTTEFEYVYDTTKPALTGLGMMPPSPALKFGTKFATINHVTSTFAKINSFHVATLAEQPIIPAAVIALDRGSRTARGSRVMARLSQIKPPKVEGDIRIDVFVNCPYLTKFTPTNDPYYASTFGFFASGHSSGGHGSQPRPSFIIDLTPVLTRLNRLGRTVKGMVNVQLRPSLNEGRKESKTDFLVGKIEILMT